MSHTCLDLLAMEHNEPLLTEVGNRFVLFPVKHAGVWDMYKKAVASFWTPEEINFADVHEWNLLNDNEQHFIKHVLAFFAGSDGIVNENLVGRFMNEVQIPEAKAFYSFQIAIETIHSETYSLLIDTYIKDKDDKTILFDAINKIPCIKKKAEWALNWIDNNDAPFVTRLIAFAIVEGVFFSSAFASIYYIKERGILNSLTFSNELISRDESLHTEFAVLLHSMIQNKMMETDVHSMMREAVEIEIEFITHSLPCNLLGMNTELMSEYVKYVADRLLKQLGYAPLYGITKCPFDFMERISITNKSNFFEVRVSEYSKANVGVDAANTVLQFTSESDDIDF